MWLNYGDTNDEVLKKKPRSILNILGRMHTIKRQDHQSRYESTFRIRSCNEVDIATVLGKNDMDTSDRLFVCFFFIQVFI